MAAAQLNEAEYAPILMGLCLYLASKRVAAPYASTLAVIGQVSLSSSQTPWNVRRRRALRSCLLPRCLHRRLQYHELVVFKEDQVSLAYVLVVEKADAEPPESPVVMTDAASVAATGAAQAHARRVVR